METFNQTTTMAEKRKFKRVLINTEATIKTQCLGEKKVIVKNISEGGGYIEISFPKIDSPLISFLCLRNEKIHLTICSKKPFTKIEVVCIAKWDVEINSSTRDIEKKYGLGVEFINLSLEQKNRIVSFILDCKSKREKDKFTEWTDLEKRIYPRFAATLPVTISSRSPHSKFNKFSGYTVNISKGGTAIISNRSLQKCKSIILTLEVPPDSKQLKLFGEVVWCNNLHGRKYFQFGAKFSEISPENLNIIEQVVEFKRTITPKKADISTFVAPTIISEPLIYKNKFGNKIIGMYDHSQNLNLEQPFIIIPPAHGETKKNSIMLSYYLVANGFNVVRYDNTNHLGESDGNIYFTTLDNVKEDMIATLNYIQKHFGVISMGMIASSLTSRVSIRVASEDQRIKYLLCLVGVVNIQHTLKAVYQEDIIDLLISNRAQDRMSFNILGYESDKEYPISAIRNNLHSVESTMEDLDKIMAPVIAIAAEKDAWVDINEVEKGFLRPSKFPRGLFIIKDAMHYFYENLTIAKKISRLIVSQSIKYLCRDGAYAEKIEEPDYHLIAHQNNVEKERLRKHELSKEDEKQFWSKYLNKYIIIDKSPDYKEYLNSITKLIPWQNRDIKILDAGCGPGHFGLWLIRELAKNDYKYSYTCIGIDFVETALRIARRNYISLKETLKKNTSIDIQANHFYILSDLDTDIFPYSYLKENTLSICLKDNIFDMICCSLLISYLKNPLETLKKLIYTLKHDGIIIVSSLKPYADLSLAFKNMVASMNSNEEIEEARLLLNSVGLIRQKESEGHYQFYSEDELVNIVSLAGGKNLNVFKTFTNQINMVVAQK